MKNAISIIFVITLISMMFTSCAIKQTEDSTSNIISSTTTVQNLQTCNSNNIILDVNASAIGKYEVLENSGFDSSSEATHISEINVSFENYTNVDAVKEKTTVIDGKTVTGSYRYSVRSGLYAYDVDCYEYSETGARIKFGINKSSGECYIYSWVDTSYTTTVIGNKLNRDECAIKATDYIEGLVDDSDAYVITSEQYREIPEYDAIYVFEFTRKINGIATSDQIYVSITVYGKICSHRMIMPSKMNDISITKSYSDDEYIKSINEKVYRIYSGIYDKYTCNHTVSEVTLVRLNSGKYAYKYCVETQLVPIDSQAIGCVEQTNLLIVID